jgi:large subunit ribosomal protein L23
MDYTQVLLRPLLTEKTSILKGAVQQVTFFVHPAANKIAIKRAVEKAFDVTVQAVNVVNKPAVNRTRQGRVVGRTPGRKKAYVTLAEGDTIEFFEGV